MKSRERFLAAVEGSEVDRPPIWLMRQAGRYLPDYQAVRKAHSFWELCESPALTTRVALEPLQLFALDAAIVFSDILVVPRALGLGVTFEAAGPSVKHLLRTEADLSAWDFSKVEQRLLYVSEAAADLRNTLQGSHGLLGFAGAPFTLFCYAVEGSSEAEFEVARTMLLTQPDLARRAMEKMSDVVLNLCRAQVKAGVDVIQLFDTWAGLLSETTYRHMALPALSYIVKQLQSDGTPVMLYARGGLHLLSALKDTGARGISLDWRTPWREARAQLPSQLLQGQLDPLTLLANEASVQRETKALLDDMRATSDYRHCIVNLGHGILPSTPISSVQAMVKTVVESGRGAYAKR
jgi:uroporphyrinogen decarboxylase